MIVWASAKAEEAAKYILGDIDSKSCEVVQSYAE
jgi:hypothetical protein